MFPLNALENHEQEPALLTCKGGEGYKYNLANESKGIYLKDANII